MSTGAIPKKNQTLEFPAVCDIGSQLNTVILALEREIPASYRQNSLFLASNPPEPVMCTDWRHDGTLSRPFHAEKPCRPDSSCAFHRLRTVELSQFTPKPKNMINMQNCPVSMPSDTLANFCRWPARELT